VGERRIAELSGIGFDGAKDITAYAKKGREVCRDLAMELEAAAEMVLGVLSRQHGHPLLFGIDVRMRARKVSRRLQRAAECAQGAGIEVVKFRSEFRYQFANVLAPPKRRGGFDFEDDE
jgi:hypothetical protein